MADDFKSMSPGLSSPATKAFSVTPDDSNDLPAVTRALYIGGGGTITFIAADDTVAVAHVVQDFQELHVRVKRVMQTGTDATSIVGWY